MIEEPDQIDDLDAWLAKEQAEAMASNQSIEPPTDEQIAIWKALAGEMIFGP